MHIPFRTYQRYEVGERPPKGKSLDNIVRFSGRSAQWILTGSEDSSSIGDQEELKVKGLLATIRSAGLIKEAEAMLEYLANSAKARMRAERTSKTTMADEAKKTIEAIDKALDQEQKSGDQKKESEKKRA